MQHGDWRLQHVGPPDELPLIQAVYLLVGLVFLWVLAWQVVREDRRAGEARSPSRRRARPHTETDPMSLSSSTTTPAPGYLGGIVRTGLGFAGGFLVAKGYISAEQLPIAGGVLLGAITLVWSIVHKKNLAAALQDALDAGRGYRP